MLIKPIVVDFSYMIGAQFIDTGYASQHDLH